MYTNGRTIGLLLLPLPIGVSLFVQVLHHPVHVGLAISLLIHHSLEAPLSISAKESCLSSALSELIDGASHAHRLTEAPSASLPESAAPEAAAPESTGSPETSLGVAKAADVRPPSTAKTAPEAAASLPEPSLLGSSPCASAESLSERNLCCTGQPKERGQHGKTNSDIHDYFLGKKRHGVVYVHYN